jgi:nucleotide-binding universal stress UspA family protein
MYERILVATDGSAISKRAVRDAIRLAAEIGTEVVAVHVVPCYPASYLEGAVGFSARDRVGTEKLWKQKGQELVDAVAKAAHVQGVESQAVVVQSNDVADALVRTAKRMKCDLIVMASHGRKGLKRVLLGSETQHVLTHGRIPTLVLR